MKPAMLTETFGTCRTVTTLELLDEGGKARLRVREELIPVMKASIFLSREDLIWLAEHALLLEAELAARGIPK